MVGKLQKYVLDAMSKVWNVCFGCFARWRSDFVAKIFQRLAQ